MPSTDDSNDHISALESDGLLWRLLEVLPDFVAVLTFDGAPVYLNPAARKALGLGPNEAAPSFFEFRPPGYADYFRDVIRATIEREGLWRGETEFVTRGGDVLRVSQTSMLYTAPKGGRYICSICRELGPADQWIDGLRRSEERMRFALTAARAGVWEVDLRTGRVTWSDSMRAVQGFTDDEFGGTLESFLALVHPEDRDVVRDLMAPTPDQPEDFRSEFRTLWADGSTHWIDACGRVVTNAAGVPERVLGMAQDVTDRHMLEAQLHHAQKIEAVGQLAGGIAHDFNNLLTAVLGFGRLLEREFPEGDPRRDDAQEIVRAGEQAAQLTRQLLAFSRRQTMQPALIDVNELVESLSRMLRRLIGEHVTFDLRLQDPLPRVKADQSQVEQVVVNLAINARDAMEHGGTLTIATRVAEISGMRARQLELAAGRYVQLTMTDTGAGMTDEVKSRIFEPFFTTKARGKGTGLGLATVFGIVKQSGGAIAVTSRVGIGTAFELFFPAAGGGGEAQEVSPVLEALAPNTEMILLVEDEPAVRTLVERLLRRRGYRVVVASRPEEAQELAAGQTHIDLVLTDIRMPGGSGPALATALRATRPGLRVLYMSAFPQDAVGQPGVPDDAAVLTKPFSEHALLTAVREALGRPAS